MFTKSVSAMRFLLLGYWLCQLRACAKIKSMSLYNKLFAKIYDPFMKGAETGALGRLRAELLGALEGEILDVGTGTGINLQYFNNKNTHIFAVEPSAPMLDKAKLKASADQNISFINLGINDPSLHDVIKPNSLDAIVCTLVLCTIPDPMKSLQQFKKWLKPNGQLIVIEHIKSKNKTNARFQHIVNPAWKIIGEGCNLTRDTDQLIREAGFVVAGKEDTFVNGITWYYGVFVTLTSVDKLKLVD